MFFWGGGPCILAGGPIQKNLKWSTKNFHGHHCPAAIQPLGGPCHPSTSPLCSIRTISMLTRNIPKIILGKTQKKLIGGRGEEGKRGPFRGQNFCGSPSQVDGHGWPRSRVEGGLTRVPGRRAAKKNKKNNNKKNKNNGIYSVSAKNGKSSKKEF